MATIQAKSVRRREDLRLLTGQGNYAADAAPAGMAVAIFLRSPYAHARIERDRCQPRARTVPGVIAVYTAADLTDVTPIPGGIGFPRPDGGPSPKTDRPLLAPIASVSSANPSRWSSPKPAPPAWKPPRPITVDYASLARRHRSRSRRMAPGAPAVWDDVPDNIGYLWKRGDVDGTEAALGRSAHVTKLEFSVSRVTANTMEPRGAWASIGPDGRIVVHASNQSPFNLRNGMANGNFNIPPTDIRVMPGDVGGSFGMKSGVHLEVVLVAWAARKLNRPVRWISERTEGFLTDEQAREMRIVAELGLDANNKFTALKLRWNVNLGAYVSGRSGWPVGNVGGIAGRLHHSGDLRRGLRHSDPHRADRRLSRRRPARSDLRHRAPDRRRRARTGHLPLRTAAHQPDSARGDAVQDRADLPLRLRRVRRQHASSRRTGGTSTLSSSAGRRPRNEASCAASA